MMIIRRLAEHKNQNKDLPSPLSFQQWVRQHFRSSEGKAGLDPWGRPYYLVLTRSQITVGSQGADRRRDTGDDIRTSVPLL